MLTKILVAVPSAAIKFESWIERVLVKFVRGPVRASRLQPWLDLGMTITLMCARTEISWQVDAVSRIYLFMFPLYEYLSHNMTDSPSNVKRCAF